MVPYLKCPPPIQGYEWIVEIPFVSLPLAEFVTHIMKTSEIVKMSPPHDSAGRYPHHATIVRAPGACVLVLARSVSTKYSKFTVNVLRRAVRSVSQTNAIAGITGEPARYH